MVDASELLQFEVGDRSVRGVEEARKNSSVYRMQIQGIDCPDARLIAAAPDLAEALEGCLNYLENTEAEFGVILSSAEKARAALAKAKGEAA